MEADPYIYFEWEISFKSFWKLTKTQWVEGRSAILGQHGVFWLNFYVKRSIIDMVVWSFLKGLSLMARVNSPHPLQLNRVCIKFTNDFWIL